MKAKTARLTQVIRIPAPSVIRQTPVKAAGLYLLELRSHAAQQGNLPKRRLLITIDAKGLDPGDAKLVKISHT